MATQSLPPQLHTPAVFPGPAASLIPTVLTVDGDRACVEHCGRMLEDLNYPHFAASTAREALELLTQEPSIQIMVTCTLTPPVDGFLLIEEARSRIGHSRPLAAIITTSRVTSELAVKGLHVEALDLLCKPIDFASYSTALRRAIRYLGTRRSAADDASIADFGQQLGQLMAMLETASAERDGETAPTDQQIGATLRAIINVRSLRTRYFPSQIFADPAWDILLDLTRAKLDGQQVSVSSVCIAASVPMSTALRWVKQMTDAGLLLRWTDPKDRRRDLIALTDSTASHMREYLSVVHKTLRVL